MSSSSRVLPKIQTFQNISLRKITNSPPFVSNLILENDLPITTILDETKFFYIRFHNRLSFHYNPLIKNVSTLSIPGNPQDGLRVNSAAIF